MNIVLMRLITKLMCHNSCPPYVRKRCCLKSILVVVLTDEIAESIKAALPQWRSVKGVGS
ncbi:Uncharacterised protein [Kluyvera cryocrescens]|uniref:Uncharacterized protein n=1 Tax=Kluyvera cryocrescens TaxID=580 RepID=A0A485AT28_KLUCR|nr:Uncharacterised protein [Kluyvera cryocrescens]